MKTFYQQSTKKESLIILLFLLVSSITFAQGSNIVLANSTTATHPDTLFTRLADKLVKEPDVVKKEAIYQALLKEFPAENNEFRKNRYYYLKMSLGLFWASKGNKEKALEYYDQVKKTLGSGMAVAYASGFLRNKYHPEVIKILDDWMDTISKEALNKSYLYTYLQANDFYSQALLKMGKKQEALKYISAAYDKSDKKNIQVNSTFSIVLNSLNKHTEALPIMENLIRTGMATEEIKNTFKDSYLKNNGKAEELVHLMDTYQNELNNKMIEEAIQKIIDEPSFSFSLRDLNGQMVTLSDLKGKVVILDFWATWCGPCIQSMPAMQLAAKHYEKDPNVVFLFIDTGEKIDDFESAVKKLLKENNYDFHVLYDVRDPVTNKYPVLTGYKITGIPTKFILDAKGNIRYRLVGYNGGKDATVAEIIAMIENIRNK